MVSVLGMLLAPLELYCTLLTLFCTPGCWASWIVSVFSGFGLSLTNDSHQVEVRWWEKMCGICCWDAACQHSFPEGHSSYGVALSCCHSLNHCHSLLWVPETAPSFNPFRFRGGNGSSMLLSPGASLSLKGSLTPANTFANSHSLNSPQLPCPRAPSIFCQDPK